MTRRKRTKTTTAPEQGGLTSIHAPLDDLWAEFDRYLARSMSASSGPAREIQHSYFHGRPIPLPLIREFFDAALAYREMVPWQAILAEDPLHLDIPRLNYVGVAASVITDDGFGGLQLFRDRTLLGLGFDPDDPGQTERLRRGNRVVMFYPRSSLPQQLRSDLSRLPFASKLDLLPALVAADEQGRTRALTPRDYTIAIVALRGVASFVDAHRAALSIRPGKLRAPISAATTALAAGEAWELALAHPGDLPQTELSTATRPDPRSIHRLKITLKGAKPPIWRRIEVPSSMTLRELHRAIQVAFEWSGHHLHAFSVGEREFDEVEEAKVEIGHLLFGPGDDLQYVYDFGDDWLHDIVTEELRIGQDEAPTPRCTHGRRAAPPEDCGGIQALNEMLRSGALRGAEEFSIDALNADLQRAFAARGSPRPKRVHGRV